MRAGWYGGLLQSISQGASDFSATTESGLDSSFLLDDSELMELVDSALGGCGARGLVDLGLGGGALPFSLLLILTRYCSLRLF